ncbi:hypothetical protein FHG87_025607, partial [Trinorchestia longiramus]
MWIAWLQGNWALPSVCRLRCYELLYLWNVLGCCSLHHLQQLHDDCESMRLPADLTALAKLVAGVCLDHLDHPQEAVLLLQEV